MRFGFVVPHADARDFAEIATLGEQHGWDGIFTWEAVFGVPGCLRGADAGPAVRL
jgi:hypothetical protein